ncbi:hypothetical protein BC835DRAFT_1379222 [Cytidiella melzeri]|nr:hypothetical protein BC835DRAFT_1379222 [Cytidiella melzeri]
MLDDDDDRFLYGDSADAEEAPPRAIATSVPQPIPLDQVEALANTNGVVANLEAKVAGDASGDSKEGSELREGPESGEVQGEEEAEEEEEEEEEESDDDIEIITEKPNRSLDFRQRPPLPRPGHSASFSTSQRPQQSAPSLTTEYTPRERGAATNLSATPQPGSGPSAPQAASSSPLPASDQRQGPQSDGVDTSTLPIVTAPPSHPQIDLDTPGVMDGRSILEFDLNALAEKNWRRPGADISDWFNYGFDELSWEAYCYRRREVNELANVLKANVLSFAGMPEEQVAALPPEVRTMIMAMVASGGGNTGGMMPQAMNMNGPMMGGMMGPMGGMMGPMMHDMGPTEMGMVGQGMGIGMGDGMGGQPMPGPGIGGPGMVGPNMNNGPLSGGVAIGSAVQGRATPDVQMGMMGDSFQGGPQGVGQQGIGMPMGADYGMQEMNQQMYPGVEGNVPPAPVTTATRGGPPGHFVGRGRGIPVQAAAVRGVRGGSYAGRGRALPVRPASPLPPNVPTGPRNKNKYKDIDNSAPAVDGLDYGGGKERSTPPEHDERGSRKRRSSPGLEENRGSKRR